MILDLRKGWLEGVSTLASESLAAVLPHIQRNNSDSALVLFELLQNFEDESYSR